MKYTPKKHYFHSRRFHPSVKNVGDTEIFRLHGFNRDNYERPQKKIVPPKSDTENILLPFDYNFSLLFQSHKDFFQDGERETSSFF